MSDSIQFNFLINQYLSNAQQIFFYSLSLSLQSKAMSQGPYVWNWKDILAQKRVGGDGEFGYELLMDGRGCFGIEVEYETDWGNVVV